MRALAVLVLAGLLAAAPASGASNPLLTVRYDNGAITLTLGSAPLAQAAVIAPGVYDLNFVIVSGEPLIRVSGPGIAIDYDEDASFATAETLYPDSTYTVRDNRPGSPSLVFSTGDAVPGATTTTTTPPKGPGQSNSDLVGSAHGPSRGTLEATLAADGVPTLVRAGKRVTRVAPGRWTFQVRDRTAHDELDLQKAGGTARTLSPRTFVGTRKVTLVLAAGRWTLSTGAGGQLTFRVG